MNENTQVMLNVIEEEAGEKFLAFDYGKRRAAKRWFEGLGMSAAMSALCLAALTVLMMAA